MGPVWCAVLLLFPTAVVTASRDGAFLLDLLKKDADPCTNFYDKVCGGWIENTSISFGGETYKDAQVSFWNQVEALLNKTTYGEGDSMLRKMSTAYKQCLKHEQKSDAAEQTLNSLLDELGICKWPNTDESQANRWMDLFVKVSTALDLNVLLDITVRPDEKDRSSYAIMMRMPSLGIAKDILMSTSSGREDVKELEPYQEYINKTMGLISGKVDAPSLIDDIIEFERKLAQISDIFWNEMSSAANSSNDDDYDYSNYDNYDYSNYDNFTFEEEEELPVNEVPVVDLTHVKKGASRTVDELSSLAPGIEWKHLLSQLFKTAGLSVNGDDKIVLLDKAYYKNLHIILNSTKASTISNYFGWRVIQTLGPLLDSRLAAAKQKFDEVMGKSQKLKSQRDLCLDEFASEYGTARELIGHFYAKEHLLNESKARVDELMHTVRSTYKKIIENNDWLSNATRKNVLYKLTMGVSTIGYPKQLMNNTYIEETYGWLDNVTEDTGLLKILRLFRENRRLNELRKLRGKHDRTYHIGYVSPTSVDPYYSLVDNGFVFPAASLQTPFYDSRYSDEILTGMFGWILARVMSYGLIPNADRFGADGDFLEQSFWSVESKGKAENKMTCFNNLYQNVTSNDNDNTKGFPRRTLSSDVVDNIGLNVAFKALKNAKVCSEARDGNYTREQRFFLTAGVSMCMGMREMLLRKLQDASYFSSAWERINFPFGNMPEFTEAFQCKGSSSMIFQKRCTFW